MSARRRTRTLTVAALALACCPVRLGEAVASDAAVVLPPSKPVHVDPRRYVRDRAARVGWIGREWRCIDALVYRESRWHPHSKNARSSAYGLFQFLHMKPGTSLAKQYAQFERYIAARYGSSPCEALAHSTARGWY